MADSEPVDAAAAAAVAPVASPAPVAAASAAPVHDVSYYTSIRPVWVADNSAPDCTRCSKAWTPLNRRHHCRHCGKMFCAKCTSTKVPIPKFGYTDSVRVCANCVPLVDQPLPAPPAAPTSPKPEAPASSAAVFAGERPLVVVTGGTGFLALHVVDQLLRAGWPVVATVRNLDNEAKNGPLRALDTQGGRLRLVKADLTGPAEEWEAALAGATYVLHTASPFIIDVTDPQKELVDPAVAGTLAVLKAAKKTPSVKRVVLTSSVAAVTDEPINGKVYTEADWNLMSSLDRNPYFFSKTVAERAAWEFMGIKQPEPESAAAVAAAAAITEKDDTPCQFDLVTVNPFLIIGPSINPKEVNPSVEVIKDIVGGKFPAVVSFAWCFVDVRDVAATHIAVMDNAMAAGRYLICHDAMQMIDLVRVLRPKYSDWPIPHLNLNNTIGVALTRFSANFETKNRKIYINTNVDRIPQIQCKERLASVGIQLRDLNESLYATVDQLIATGILKKKDKGAKPAKDGKDSTKDTAKDGKDSTKDTAKDAVKDAAPDAAPAAVEPDAAAAPAAAEV